jgi:predicted ATPase
MRKVYEGVLHSSNVSRYCSSACSKFPRFDSMSANVISETRLCAHRHNSNTNLVHNNSKMRLKMELIDRYLKKTDESFFLFGPRGTGKSTWIGMVFEECRPLLLYRGFERLLRHEILCLSCEEFLHQLCPERSLDAGI